jgi:hypothetical protein
LERNGSLVILVIGSHVCVKSNASERSNGIEDFVGCHKQLLQLVIKGETLRASSSNSSSDLNARGGYHQT